MSSFRWVAFFLILLAPMGAHAQLFNLDFSSGTFLDIPPENGTDYYEQDGFIVELENSALGINSATCPGRWCAQNPYTASQEVTLLTASDGGRFTLVSVQITENSQGVTFSADGGAYLKYDGVGTATFGPEFEGVTIVSIGIPCSGQYVSCAGTIDNIRVVKHVAPVEETSWGGVKALYYLPLR